MVVAVSSESLCAPAPIPRLRLFSEKVLVARGDGSEEEVDLPVLGLCFDYGGTRVAAHDERRRFFVAHGGSLVSVERDLAAEARANELLERLGAVELGCLPGYEAPFDSEANYVVAVEGDVHAYCSFSTHAVPQLEAAGFRVSIDADYPYQIVDARRWYVGVEPLAERADWFGCELGVEVDGSRINLLGALVDLLDSIPEGAGLSALTPQSRRFVAVPIDDHHYVPVAREVMEGLLEVLREMYGARRAADGRFELCRSQAPQVSALADSLGSGQRRCVWYAPESFRRAASAGSLRDRSELRLESAPVEVQLRPYQAVGVAWLQRLCELDYGGVLADDMGLGKTLQTITHLALEHSGRAQAPSLIVAPTSLVRHWEREINRFAPKLTVGVWHGAARKSLGELVRGSDIVITSYSLVAREQEAFAEHPFHLLVLDEAQAIKNPRAAARRALCAIDSRHRLCLSGTPVENHLGDLWSLMDFVLPGLLGDSASFQEHYRGPIEQGKNETQLAALRRAVAPFILRRTKEEVASDLPAKTQIVRPVALSGRQRQLYEAIRVAAHEDVRSVIRKKGVAGSTIAILDALMKLRQVCCDPRLVRVNAAREVAESAKLEDLLALIEQQLAQGRRILVFSQFTSMLDIISRALGERGIEHLVLTGATQDRQAKVDAFQRGAADVFLISLKAGGTGLNLTRADTVIHYDPWWNPTAQAQATDRAHRIGQTRPVFVYQLIVAGSVEERMLELQQRKFALAQGIIGRADDSPALLTEQDVASLFSPLDE